MRRVILTGASAGIGRESAVLLSRAGCSLVLVARRADRLDETVARCEAGSAVAFAADLMDREAPARIIEFARSLGGDVEPVLINNAGYSEFGEFAALPLDVNEAQIAVNYLAPVRLCHAALPWMLERGSGQIVNVLSIAARHVFPGAAAYGSSKAALLMHGRIVAAEYRARGVRVTSILPGSVDTELWDGKEWRPPSEDMLPVSAVAEAIRDVVMSPRDRNIDEIVLMPPKGIL